MSQPEPEAADQVLQWITLLQGNVDEYGGLLNLDDLDSFQASLENITSLLHDDPGRAAEGQTDLIELVSRYPSVGEWLVGADPGYRDLPGVNEPMAVEPDAEPAQAEAAQPAPAQPAPVRPKVVAPAAAAAAEAEAEAEAEAPARVPVAALAPSEAPARSKPAADGADKVNPPKAAAAARSWTPDVVMQAGKEVVTALIGLTIIGSTIALVARSFGLIGNSNHIGQAKDLLSIMLGLVGTVIGYYFGRVPADARATAATTRADQATAEKENVKAKARGLADQMDGLISPTSMNALSRGDLSAHQDNLQRVRQGLRDLSGS